MSLASSGVSGKGDLSSVSKTEVGCLESLESLSKRAGFVLWSFFPLDGNGISQLMLPVKHPTNV